MNWLRNFMMGRYGVDQMNVGILVAMMVCTLLSSLTGFLPLYLLGIALMCWAIFRILSRNYERRRAENAAFLRLAGPVIRWCKLRRCARRDRDYCYFTCPHCKQMLRAPKGKGKIHVTCRTCGTVFEKTT